MAAAATVTLQQSIPGMVKFKYVCDAAPAATNVNIGFVPSVVMLWNVTDKTVFTVYSAGMAAGTAMTIAAAAAAVATGGITPLDSATAGVGFSIGTDATVQVASKTFEGVAFR